MNDAAMIAENGQLDPPPSVLVSLPTQDLVLDDFSDDSRAAIEARGLTTDLARTLGLLPVRAVQQLPAELQANRYASNAVPGILFPWTDVTDGELVWQYRPDHPDLNDQGDPVKYVFGIETKPVVGLVRDGAPGGPVLIVEGSFQSLVAARYAAPDVTVLSLSGCWNFGSDRIPYELPVVSGRPVVVCLDADAASNRQVYDAGMRLASVCQGEGAASVGFVRLPAGGSTGLDDMLAQRREATRADWLGRQVELAKAHNRPASPAPKKTAKRTDGNPYIDANGGLLVQRLAADIVRETPALITTEGAIAFYGDGSFHVEQDALPRQVARVMGDQHRSGHIESVRQSMAALLEDAGWTAPRKVTEPLVCVGNGMLDLRTGTLLAHDPAYRAISRLEVDYPTTPEQFATPVYDAWTKSVGITEQLSDLEEATSMMLDPSRDPAGQGHLPSGAVQDGEVDLAPTDDGHGRAGLGVRGHAPPVGGRPVRGGQPVREDSERGGGPVR